MAREMAELRLLPSSGSENGMDVMILLLVEDDVDLRPLLEAVLKDEGFEVTLASSGAEAIEKLDATGAAFKGLVTDIRLGPGPDGWAVGHHAREVFSSIPVIYMSGDSAHEWAANGVPESVMLQKPFVMAQLITAISTLLNHTSSALPPSDSGDGDK